MVTLIGGCCSVILRLSLSPDDGSWWSKLQREIDWNAQRFPVLSAPDVPAARKRRSPADPARQCSSHCQRHHGHTCHPASPAAVNAGRKNRQPFYTAVASHPDRSWQDAHTTNAGACCRGAHVPHVPPAALRSELRSSRAAQAPSLAAWDPTLRPKRMALAALWTWRCHSAFDCRRNGGDRPLGAPYGGKRAHSTMACGTQTRPSLTSGGSIGGACRRKGIPCRSARDLLYMSAHSPGTRRVRSQKSICLFIECRLGTVNNLITNVAESCIVLCVVKRTRKASHVEAADACRVCSHAQTQLLRQSTRAWRRSCGACKHHRCANYSLEIWKHGELW